MKCSETNCTNAARIAGLCPKCYRRDRYGSKPLDARVDPMPKCSVESCSLDSASREGELLCAPHYQKKYRGLDYQSYEVKQEVKKCWVDICPRPAQTKGLCNTHARRARTGRIEVPAELGVKLNAPCAFEGCENPYASKKLCHSHYEQFRRGEELRPLRDYGKYTSLENSCAVDGCKKIAATQEMCTSHAGQVARYGLSFDELNALSAIKECQNPGCNNTKRLCIDHDHATGKVRGVLCTWCNSALGMVHEDIDRLSGLIEYKRSHA